MFAVPTCVWLLHSLTSLVLSPYSPISSSSLPQQQLSRHPIIYSLQHNSLYINCGTSDTFILWTFMMWLFLPGLVSNCLSQPGRGQGYILPVFLTSGGSPVPWVLKECLCNIFLLGLKRQVTSEFEIEFKVCEILIVSWVTCIWWYESDSSMELQDIVT